MTRMTSLLGAPRETESSGLKGMPEDKEKKRLYNATKRREGQDARRDAENPRRVQVAVAFSVKCGENKSGAA